MSLWGDTWFWAYIRNWNAYFWQLHFEMFIDPMNLIIFVEIDEGLFWNYQESPTLLEIPSCSGNDHQQEAV